MTLPTFMIIGAPKCGSSALYEHLVADRRVVMSTTKEPAYFGVRHDRGLEWYEQQFVGRGDVVGEATVGYLSDPKAAPRIQALLPEVKMVVLARNPFDRARSHYWWRHNRGIEARSFDEVLADGADAFPIADGLYFRNLAQFLELFPLERFLVIQDTDLRRDRHGLDRLWEFIGLTPPSDRPAVTVANSATAPRSAGATKAVRGLHRLRGLRSYVPAGVRRAGSGAISRADRLSRAAFVAPPLTAAQTDVMSRYFLDDVAGLERLVGLELAPWRRPSTRGEEPG